MGPRWKLEVEGLGKIERAEVDVRPLMLFVGENNTGKSYLASLLWGLLALQGELEVPDGPTLKTCEAWMTKKAAEHPNHEEFALTLEDQALFLDVFNEALARSKDRLVQRIFNNEEASVSRIAVRDAAPGLSMSISAESIPDMTTWSVAVEVDGHHETLGPAPTAMAAMHIAPHIALANLREIIPYPEFDGLQRHGMPLFLPAARSGFMLFYPSVVSRQLRQLMKRTEADSSRLEITAPSIPLLELLAVGLKPQVGPYAAEADFLEAPLAGRVELESGLGINRYYYRPANSKTRLTMSLSSSLVTELAPLIVILRHFGGFPVLILEEPEVCLHPTMQRHLARTVVRLIRKGLYVWVTTHSVDFCQQINNFIKMGESPKRAELQKHLGYEEHEYLTLDDVSGYGFTLQDGGEKSIVRELKKTAQGLSMPTFNEELIRLRKEMLYLQGETTE